MMKEKKIKDIKTQILLSCCIKMKANLKINKKFKTIFPSSQEVLSTIRLKGQPNDELLCENLNF